MYTFPLYSAARTHGFCGRREGSRGEKGEEGQLQKNETLQRDWCNYLSRKYVHRFNPIGTRAELFLYVIDAMGEWETMERVRTCSMRGMHRT
jgi:hypothetical protein